MAFPGMMAAPGGDEQLQNQYKERLFIDARQHLIKAGDFPNLKALQDATGNYGRSLEACDRLKTDRLDDDDTDMADAHPRRQRVDDRKTAKRATAANASGGAKDSDASKADKPGGKRKFTGTVGKGKPPSPCFHCGGDHWANECKKKKKADDSTSKKGKFVPKSTKNPEGSLTKKQLWDQKRCFKCGKEGHQAKECTVRCTAWFGDHCDTSPHAIASLNELEAYYNMYVHGIPIHAPLVDASVSDYAFNDTRLKQLHSLARVVGVVALAWLTSLRYICNATPTTWVGQRALSLTKPPLHWMSFHTVMYL